MFCFNPGFDITKYNPYIEKLTGLICNVKLFTPPKNIETSQEELHTL